MSSNKVSTAKVNNSNNCHEEIRDSRICALKVVLPTKEQLINGDVEFSNEEIRILEHPDFSANFQVDIEDPPASSSSQRSRNENNYRRAAIGDKV